MYELRTITGFLRSADGAPRAGANVRIVRETAVADGDAFAPSAVAFYTGSDGAVPEGTAVAVPASGSWPFALAIDNAPICSFALGAGDPITLAEILALAGQQAGPDTAQAEFLNSLYALVNSAADGQMLETAGGDLALVEPPEGTGGIEEPASDGLWARLVDGVGSWLAATAIGAALFAAVDAAAARLAIGAAASAGSGTAGELAVVDAAGNAVRAGYAASAFDAAGSAAAVQNLALLRDGSTTGATTQVQTFINGISAGTTQIAGANSGININSAHNTVGNGCDTYFVAGGQSAAPNRIGYAGKPVGTDYTPTGWADDIGYPAGAADLVFIGGGYDNVANQLNSTIVGGGHNFVMYHAGGHGFIGGGAYNLLAAGWSAIAGGLANGISGANSNFNFIGGGQQNEIVGSYSVIPGGSQCRVNGNYGFAFGHQAISGANGAFTLADSQAGGLTNSTADRFVARFTGGYEFRGGDVGFAGKMHVGSVTPDATWQLKVTAASAGYFLAPSGQSMTLALGTTSSNQNVTVSFREVGANKWDWRYMGATDSFEFYNWGISNVHLAMLANGNTGFRTTSEFGLGVGVIGIRNCTTPPSTNPTDGGVLFPENGALKWRGSNGTVTTIAPA